MSNEEKIISMLADIQKDISLMKVGIENLQGSDCAESKEDYIARQLTALEGMRSVLTRDEAEKLAEIVGI